MGRRASSKELAQIWVLSVERVNQFARAGKITKGPDGLFDLDEAMAFRRQQISDGEVQTLLKTYGNRHGTVTGPKAIEHAVAAERGLVEVPLSIEHQRAETMVLDIMMEFVNEVPLRMATSWGGGVPDDAVVQAIHESMLAELTRVQEIAMRYGSMVPDAE